MALLICSKQKQKNHCLPTSPLSINFLVLRSQISKTKASTYLPACTYLEYQSNKSNGQSLNWTNPTLFRLSLLTLFLQSGRPILIISDATNPPHLPRSPAKPSEHSERNVPFPRTPAWIRSHKIPWNVMIFSIGAYFGHHNDRTELRKDRGNTIRPGKRCRRHFFSYRQTIWNWNLSALSLNWWVTEI